MKTKYYIKKSTQDETKDARRSEAKKTVDEGINALLEEIKAGKTERLVQWFNYCAQFHRYSPANQYLIAEQCRRRDVYASHVASYNGWQALGNERHGKPYQVKKGEKALFIWAPRPYKKEDAEGEEQAYVGFVLVPVFDASQITQGIDPETGEEHPPLEHFFTPQPNTEEAQHLYETLKGIAISEGYSCYEEARSDGLQGYNQGKTIVVKSSLDSTSKFSTFVHEYTHAVLHQDVTLGKRDQEGEAEATAYVVAKHFGITNPFSSDYLLTYGNNEKTLMARMDRIRKHAHETITKLESALNCNTNIETIVA